MMGIESMRTVDPKTVDRNTLVQSATWMSAIRSGLVQKRSAPV